MLDDGRGTINWVPPSALVGYGAFSGLSTFSTPGLYRGKCQCVRSKQGHVRSSAMEEREEAVTATHHVQMSPSRQPSVAQLPRQVSTLPTEYMHPN